MGTALNYWFLTLYISFHGIKTHDIGISRTEAVPAVGVLINKENCFQTRRGYVTKTGKHLENLQRTFDNEGIDAYIISTEDVHQRATASPYNKRLSAISGFSGDIGTAVITRTEAVLWIDGRHFNQAVKETGCNWILHRKGGHNVPSLTRWIKDYFNATQNVTIGASPYFISSAWWRNFAMIFTKAGIKFKATYPELVDKIWIEGRPEEKFTDIDILPLKFAGKGWQDKMRDIHSSMRTSNTDMLVISGVDENAWLFNMRAQDTGFAPYFYSFSIIDLAENTTRLYIGRHFEQLSRISTKMEANISLVEHLNTGVDGSCQNKTGLCVEVLGYDFHSVISHIRSRSSNPRISKVWISPDVNYAIYSAIPQEKIYQQLSPASITKVQKNSAERDGMRKANMRDSVAVIRLYAKIEKDIKDGLNWTVYSAAQEAFEMRRSLDYFQEPSFSYLSGSGHTSAHLYDAISMQNLTTDEIFLQDSGGQYFYDFEMGAFLINKLKRECFFSKEITYLRDGTTDVTRVFHYGIPTLQEKEVYTRVLMAHLSLAMHRFPKGHSGHDIDSVARAPIWEVGMDYPHETGHGVSAFGSAIEGPARISCVEGSYHTDVLMDTDIFDSDIDRRVLFRVPDPSLYPLDEHMCFSDEPGIYEEGKFGVRIENVFMTKQMESQFNGTGPDFLEFETLTLVPYEPHLILYNQLTAGQIKWMNDYHARIWKEVGPLVKQSGDMIAHAWLEKRVHPVASKHVNI